MTETVSDHWTRLVQVQPEALAVVEAATGRAWTRGELDAEADAFRATLPDNIRHQRVTFALPNGGRWFAVFIGLLRAGAIPVPLDPSEPPDAQRQLASAAHARFALINDSLEPFCNLISYKPDRRTFVVKLTSGSTGQPRALAFTHEEMIADGRQICATMGIGPDDVNFAVIPLGHSYGLGNLVMPLLIQGTALICSSVPLPHALAADIALWRPTVFPAVPALLRAFAQADLPADALNSLRTVISAGTPLSPEIAQAFSAKFNLRAHSFYGSSETGGITYDRSGDATLAGRSVGTPLEGVTLTPARGGRIRVTSDTVRARGSFSPADLAVINEHGELVLKGRSGRLVKIAGRRLDLGDLERLLRALPGVRDAFACLHPQTPDELAAVLATSLDAPSVRVLLRKEFATWKIPRRLVIVAEFPLTARGKPDTRALQSLLTHH
ncbi:class I adenylate-forming enzyme family protein [Rariglobus hedericola]|uniref:Acyl--CoA ligase n=1 Tax=Rariglobus hedericola TaxID=2597822 RepID=A0A556QNB9_9BACT|nr:class I adenylate-forming enzyme family protein [Rariglobus hedericola]TSJ78102.1 acyl--CoA ligase [Rariglobus hedericola]